MSFIGKKPAVKTAKQKSSEALKAFQEARNLLIDANKDIAVEQAFIESELARLSAQKQENEDLSSKNARIADKISEIIA